MEYCKPKHWLKYTAVVLAFGTALSGCAPQKKYFYEPQKPYDGSWESLQEMPVPKWFDDGKIGIFIHWGPYSVVGAKKGDRGYAEHFPRLMYDEPDYYYPLLEQRFGAHPPEFGYKDIIDHFKAENWDPDQWASLFKDVGATYVVFTAEHHDGWANWDSDLTPWNAMDKGPNRDLVGDLGKALRKQGLKYAPSTHRERLPNHFNLREPGGKTKFTVNGVRRSDIAEEIRLNPEAALLYGPTSYSKEFVDDYVARWKEIQAKYDPDFLWMDDYPILTRDGNKSNLSRNNTNPPPPEFRPEVQYFYDQVRLMITDFMNEAAAKGKQVYLNNKGGNPNFPAGVGAYEKDNLRLKSIGPKWQSCTTFGTSFGYLAAEEREDYPFKKKSDKEVIHEMIEIISRNGNFLINIGPKADGTIPSWQVQRLKNMGTWLKINGEAIYGSRYWKHTEQKKDKLYFTVKGNDLFAIAAEQPNHPFTIKGTKGWADSTVKRVSLLGSSKQIKWHLNGKGLVIEPPKDFGESEHAWVFKIETVNNQFVRSALDKGVESIKDNEIHSKDSTDYN